jgi:hypothetical protein
VLQRELHGIAGLEGTVGLKGEALHEERIAALLRNPQPGAIDLPAGQHRDLRRRHVQMRQALDHRALAQFHKGAVGVGERDPDAPLTRHVGEVIEGEPIEARVRRRVVAAVGEELGTDHRSHFFVPPRGLP